MKATSQWASLAIMFLFASASMAGAQSMIDPSFGTKGVATFKIQNMNDDVAQSIVQLPNGRILIAGNTVDLMGNSSIGIIRLKPNGKIDRSFSDSGEELIISGSCSKVLVQPDEKILLGGWITQGTSKRLCVWRLNPDGTPDHAFGTNGFRSAEFGGNSTCNALALQPDGKILIGGSDMNFYTCHSTLSVARINADGTLDNSFGTAGKLSVALPNQSVDCPVILLQSNGKIIVTAKLDTNINQLFSRSKFFSMRLNGDGSIDKSFAHDGIQIQSNSNDDNFSSAAILSDGSIILAGESEFNGFKSASVLCLFPDGNVNPNFGTNGWKHIDFFGGTPLITCMAVQQNDKVILAGVADYPNQSHSLIATRITADGSLDYSFGKQGIDSLMLTSPALPAGCNSLFIQDDGRILLGGFRMGDSNSFFAARLQNNEQPVKNPKTESAISEDLIAEFSAFPNPMSYDPMIVSINLLQPAQINLTVSDMSGKQMITPIVKNLNEGPNTVEINFPQGLDAGMYLCVLRAMEHTRIIKFEVKQQYQQ
ncbi:MAG: T9SS type A sorting domain-containing protein [Bacteroidetes bacterium]|nr:T9SS type A sorting domain-containing protein [Bacteroidota bacterium]